MTSRSTYQFLLRLHPACFRKQFEEQMLWIFDESVASRGAAPLLIDACISLVRQWVLRSVYWRHGVRPGVDFDGATALSETLRRNAETLHRRAQRFYFLWIVGGMAVLWICPVPFSSKLNFYIYTGLLWNLFSHGGKKPSHRGVERHPFLVSLDLPESHTSINTMIEGKRASLRVKYSSGIPRAGGFLLGLFLMNVAVFFRLARVHSLSRPAVVNTTELIEYFIGLAVMYVSWLLLKRMHRRAIAAVQQEMDALDT